MRRWKEWQNQLTGVENSTGSHPWFYSSVC